MATPTRHFSVGLIGGGNITTTHARAARATPGVEISAIYGTNSEKIAHLCHEHGGTPIKISTLSSAIAPWTSSSSAVPPVSTPHKELLPLKRASTSSPKSPSKYSNSRWRGTFALDGGGALINQAVYTVDLLLWLFGQLKNWIEQCLLGKLLFIDASVKWFRPTINRHRGHRHPRTRPHHPRKYASATTTTLIEPAHDQNRSSSSAAVSDFRGHQTITEDFLHSIQHTPAHLRRRQMSPQPRSRRIHLPRRKNSFRLRFHLGF